MLRVKPEAYGFFVSSNSDLSIEENIEMKIEIPTQLPKGMT